MLLACHGSRNIHYYFYNSLMPAAIFQLQSSSAHPISEVSSGKIFDLFRCVCQLEVDPRYYRAVAILVVKKSHYKALFSLVANERNLFAHDFSHCIFCWLVLITMGKNSVHLQAHAPTCTCIRGGCTCTRV